ncbi:MAG TPA: GGDEF domain-containing protein [Gemmatimonadales bacterium]|jgi:diguanylate cyclase (GGDEF)-like protein
MALGYFFSRRRSRAIPEQFPPPGESAPWRRLLAPPEQLQIDAGSGGELIVSRVRIVLILLLLPIPLVNLVLDPFVTAGVVGLVTCLVALLCSLVAYLVIRRDFYRPWLGLATSLFDVTMVSAGLGAFLLLGQPVTTVNSRLLFEVYFIAIGATALRYDARISVAAGLAAVVQYLGLVLYAHLVYDLNDPALNTHGYGTFDWATQISRLLLLGVTTLLAAAIVIRSQRLRRQSWSDRLTGLSNRGYFEERVQAELARARRHAQPVALAMIDVDHFKRFNDTWGHAAGDVALREVARAILAAVRQSDLVARYGGEEFVVLLPEMAPALALERVEEIRRAVAELPIRIPRRSETAHITISAGLAEYGPDGVTPEDLLDRADARLFVAKESGRNRVIGPSHDLGTQRPSLRSG